MKAPMLARLLQRVLLAQMVGVTVIGALLAAFTDLPPAAAWLLPVLLLPALPALSITRCFVLGFRHQGEHAEPTALGDWLRAGLAEISWAWRLYLWRQAVAASLPHGGVNLNAPKAPVLLIHGFFCNHRVWDAMVAHLSALGHPVWRLDLEPLYCSIDDYAPRIEAAVGAMLAGRADQRFSIIGHSMGGLVTRAWLRAFPARLEQLNAVLTLGTPHVGTLIDPKARFRNTRQMVYRSQWLTELAEHETPMLRQRFSACITRQDPIVFPQTEQWLPGMRVHTVSGIGHLEMCAHPQMLAWVSAELARERRA